MVNAPMILIAMELLVSAAQKLQIMLEQVNVATWYLFLAHHNSNN